MNMLAGAARLHKQQFDSYVDSVGVGVLVRQPAAHTTVSSAVSQVLGTPSTATGPIGSTLTISAVLNYGYSASPFAGQSQMPPAIRAMGEVENIDIVLRCRTSEALVTPGGTLGGRVIFDTCRDVVIDGLSFKVTATDRTGLPPYGPYVFWVALKKNGVAA